MRQDSLHMTARLFSRHAQPVCGCSENARGGAHPQRLALLVVASLMVPLCSLANAQEAPQPLPPIPLGLVELELAEIATGLTAPVYLTQPLGDDRRFIVEQDGQILTLENGELADTPFLDISDQLVELNIVGDERGLLGLAFHPGFSDTAGPGAGRFYTYSSQPVTGTADFTVDVPAAFAFDHQSVITEWTVDPNTGGVDLNSAREILRIDQPQFNHNAGTLAFGPDGYLYISLGDGGGADDQDEQQVPVTLIDGTEIIAVTEGHGPNGNGQNLSNVLGKILRIDVDNQAGNTPGANGEYSIPADNPFVGEDGVDEIFAYGFRNPYRFSFAPDGIILGSDAGQQTIEEINAIVAGGNYGWRLKEGTFEFLPRGTSPDEMGIVDLGDTTVDEDVIDPVAQYDHDEGIVTIGGFVYDGTAIPELVGKYVFADLSAEFATPSGRLFYADYENGSLGEIFEFRLAEDFPYYIRGFGEDASGELYVLVTETLLPNDPGGGDVYQITGARIIPEPSTLVLAALGLGTVAIARGRRPRW